MIFINYKKKNPYKESLEKFTDENRLVSFGVVKSFISGRYHWLASFLFKNRNNTQTNKHRALIGWFSDVEMNLNEYGNVYDLVGNVYFNKRPRPRIPQFYNELSSKQYKLIGQEYAEYDVIRHVDMSGKIEIPFADIGKQNHVDIFHKFGDAPAFICSGYKIPTITGYRYVMENPHTQSNIKFGNVEIVFDDKKDAALSNPYVLAYIKTLTPSATVQILGIGNLTPEKPIMDEFSMTISIRGSGDVVMVDDSNNPFKPYVVGAGTAGPPP
jgi:hypothetical protein